MRLGTPLRRLLFSPQPHLPLPAAAGGRYRMKAGQPLQQQDFLPPRAVVVAQDAAARRGAALGVGSSSLATASRSMEGVPGGGLVASW
jgi:hypothetical protein